MKQIFKPVEMNHLKMKNRLIRSATWEGIAAPDGSVTEETYAIYEELAKGGMMRLCSDDIIAQYKKLTDLIHAEGVPVLSQLALGAYYREMNGHYVQVEPDDMTAQEIRYVIRQFIDAAIRAEKAGFDGVQIHAAHFFFLSRFISPAINHRTDEYGGSTQNRARILLEILKGIREAAPKLHITIKINCDDYTFRGLKKPDCLDICRLLDQAGIDSVEVSGNGTSVEGIRPHVDEGYFVPAAAQIARSVNCPVIVVGGFRSPDVMEDILNHTQIEFISMSRPLLRQPDLPNRMKEDPTVISRCVSCNACYSSRAHKCVFRKKDQA